MWDLRSGEKTRTLRIATGLHASRSVRTVAPRRSASTSSSTCPPGGPDGDRAQRRPTWLLFSPDGDTVVSTNLDGTVTLGTSGRGTTRRSAATRTPSAARLQPRRGDPLHGEPRRNRDRLGHDGRWSRAVVQVHQRPQSRSPPGYEGHPGGSAPTAGSSRSASRTGASRSGTRRAHAGRSPLLGTRRGQIARFSPDGRTLAASAFGGVVTLWDVGSRSRLLPRERGATTRGRHRFSPTEGRSP